MHVNFLIQPTPLPLHLAPCAPTQLEVASSCDSDTIAASWQESQGSVSYMAVAESTAGHRLTCNTSDTACLLSPMLCGHDYQVYVVGVDDNCVGAMSNVQEVHSGGCQI